MRYTSPHLKPKENPMPKNKLRVGVLGAGRWANMAHIPGWLRDPRVEVVALCDVELPLARTMADSFNLPKPPTTGRP